jgi:predicted kinase
MAISPEDGIPEAGGIPAVGDSDVDLNEAARQLEQAVHDAQVAFDCLALGDIDRARVHAITARAAADAAENVLRAALGEDTRLPAGLSDVL